MEQARQALKKLNVFGQEPPNPFGNRRVFRRSFDTLSGGISGVTMTLLIPGVSGVELRN
jgi:hypothetical protein